MEINILKRQRLADVRLNNLLMDEWFGLSQAKGIYNDYKLKLDSIEKKIITDVEESDMNNMKCFIIACNNKGIK